VRSDRILLQDILESIAEVVENTPKSETDFDANKFVRSHLLRHIQIIGEASWRVSQAVKDAHTEVPWRQIAGMRHVLVHDYFQVNWSRVYITAREHVPVLKTQIEAILVSLSHDANP
jgi:uncharacterized protein with HEPN domain